jgi:hypothetical protein
MRSASSKTRYLKYPKLAQSSIYQGIWRNEYMTHIQDNPFTPESTYRLSHSHLGTLSQVMPIISRFYQNEAEL